MHENFVKNFYTDKILFVWSAVTPIFYILLKTKANNLGSLQCYMGKVNTQCSRKQYQNCSSSSNYKFCFIISANWNKFCDEKLGMCTCVVTYETEKLFSKKSWEKTLRHRSAYVTETENVRQKWM